MSPTAVTPGSSAPAQHAAALLTEWVDAVLLATKRSQVQKENAVFAGETPYCCRPRTLDVRGYAL